MIPNGSVEWTNGIIVTNQIFIRAQNYTRTPAGTVGSGATSRNITITNNSNAAIFSFTTGNSFHCGLAGIAFIDGSGDGAHFSIAGSGSKVALVNDIYMTVRERYSPTEQPIRWNARGGVIWNLVADASGETAAGGGVGTLGGGMFVSSPLAWNTAPTFGSLDTSGDVNVYLESSTIINCGQWPDIDDNGRFVARHCVFDGTWGITHGFTSTWGGRYFEYYDNVFSVTYNVSPYRNMAGRYFWCRAGTGLFTDNAANTPANTSEWGNVKQLDIGDNTNPTPYPQARQPGFGHDGATDVSDPIYIWNQTGGRAYVWGVTAIWSTNVVEGRDIFVNAGAKPSYSKYTYPHPLTIESVYYFPFRKP